MLALMFEPLHAHPDRAIGEHRHILVTGSRVIVRVDVAGSARALAETDAAALLGREPGDLILGRINDIHYWASRLPDGHDESGSAHDHRVGDLRSLHGVLSDEEWNIAGRATQLLEWQRDHQFCGRCGGPNDALSDTRAMRCPADGTTVFPRLSPAVIVLIERPDGRCLLGRNRGWDIPMYSTLAGFVEPGETLEDTVHREVFEEVGVRVDNVRYFGSQPWPFPNSLMLGFVAEWVGGEIAVDGEEVIDAQWFRPDDLPMIPPPMSIARELIDDWLARVGG
jgi:NAD+ diphosphatase